MHSNHHPNRWSIQQWGHIIYDITTLQIMNQRANVSPRLMAHPFVVLSTLRAQLSLSEVFNEPFEDYLDNNLREPITDGQWRSQPLEKKTWQKQVRGL